MPDVFRDMFGLPAVEGKDGNSTEPAAHLQVTKILDLFLRNIDKAASTSDRFINHRTSA
jgi:hypothetical protein